MRPFAVAPGDGTSVAKPDGRRHDVQGGERVSRLRRDPRPGERRVRGLLRELRRVVARGARHGGVQPPRGRDGSDGGTGAAARAQPTTCRRT